MAEGEAAEGVPVPPQHTQPALFDFRRSANGPRGYKCKNKRKLDDYQEQVRRCTEDMPALEASVHKWMFPHT